MQISFSYKVHQLKKKKGGGNCTLDIYLIEEKALWLFQLLVILIMETE